MRTQTILAFALFLAVQAASQDAPKLSAQAQCKFSDGTKISVSYSYERKSYLFTTDGSLVTIRGVRVPSGDYAVLPAKDQDNNWTLRMRKQILKTGDWVLPPLPMSVATKALPVGSLPVVFDQTGGSCMMYWRQKDSTSLLSLEFTRENTDMPVSD
jgi:hypothetical protein